MLQSELEAGLHHRLYSFDTVKSSVKYNLKGIQRLLKKNPMVA